MEFDVNTIYSSKYKFKAKREDIRSIKVELCDGFEGVELTLSDELAMRLVYLVQSALKDDGEIKND